MYNITDWHFQSRIGLVYTNEAFSLRCIYIDTKENRYHPLKENIYPVKPILDAIQSKGKVSYFDIINNKL